MRALERANRVRTGLLGVVVMLLIIGVGQSFSSIPMLSATPRYYGQFTDSGGLKRGDTVRIDGMDAGRVESLNIERNHILVGFTVGSNTIGTASTLAIRTDTILGKKVLEIHAHGATLKVNAVLPLDQTSTPYQISDAFFDATKAAAGWNVDSVKQSLNVLSETLNQTSPHLAEALKGVQRFADTIGSRDELLKHLLATANKVADVLGNRSEQIDKLLVNGQTLLAALNERGHAIDQLLGNVSAVSRQVEGFVADNPNINHVLAQLKVLTDQLAKHKFDLARALTTLDRFVTAISEAVASGPFFKVMVVNLMPYQVLQPWVDAAFKKRGIDPEEFWRTSGLPSFRFPDPNGKRFPNGAPAPAPTPLEGTPDHPGPAVVPGSPCSYTPTPETLPRPDNPLPCAALTQGPYGDVPSGYPPPNMATSAPNPHGPRFTPGVPSAAIPGLLSPDMPGTPAESGAPGPPGARTVPTGPLLAPTNPPPRAPGSQKG
jgi:phospholipid/cholesterol/gamma-HCH transport system substrate-binding protein